MSGKTQDWEHRYVAPRSKSLESSLQPRPDQDSVEVYPKSSSTQAQLLNQAVIVLGCSISSESRIVGARLFAACCGPTPVLLSPASRAPQLPTSLFHVPLTST